MSQLSEPLLGSTIIFFFGFNIFRYTKKLKLKVLVVIRTFYLGSLGPKNLAKKCPSTSIDSNSYLLCGVVSKCKKQTNLEEP